MEIKEIKKFEFKKCQVYIRNFGDIFEYLIVHDNKIYNTHFVIKPNFWRRWRKDRYSEKQLKEIIQLVSHGAYTAIDMLIVAPTDREKKKEEYAARARTKKIQGIR